MSFKIFRHSNLVDIATAGSVVAIGNFDGVHKGHQKVLQTTVAKAKKLSIPAIMLTFYPHPKKVFMGDKFPKPITPLAEKCRIAKSLGIDAVYVIHFTKQYATTSAKCFVQQTLHNTLNAKAVVVGDDFCFGKGRSGTMEALSELSLNHGFELSAVPQEINNNGERYSSTLVRKAIENGDVKQVFALTGRYYNIRADMLEDDMLNLVANIKHYTILKNAVYWAKIRYTRYSNIDGGIVPLTVKDGEFFIKPLPTLPDLPEGRVEIQFLQELIEDKTIDK